MDSVKSSRKTPERSSSGRRRRKCWLISGCTPAFGHIGERPPVEVPGSWYSGGEWGQWLSRHSLKPKKTLTSFIPLCSLGPGLSGENWWLMAQVKSLTLIYRSQFLLGKKKEKTKTKTVSLSTHWQMLFIWLILHASSTVIKHWDELFVCWFLNTHTLLQTDTKAPIDR